MKRITLLFLLLTTSVTFAIPVGQWECMALDSQDKSYEATGETINEAMMAATALCKNSTKERCRTAQNFCTEGPSSLQDIRCIATNTSGHSFTGTGVNACKKALSACNNWQFRNGNDSSGGQCIVAHR